MSEMAVTTNQHYQALDGLDLESYTPSTEDELAEYNPAPRGKSEVADPVRDRFISWADEMRIHFNKQAANLDRDPKPFTAELPPRVVPVQTLAQAKAVKNYAQVSAGKVGMGVRFAEGHLTARQDGSYRIAYCLVRKSERKPRSDAKAGNPEVPATTEE